MYRINIINLSIWKLCLREIEMQGQECAVDIKLDVTLMQFLAKAFLLNHVSHMNLNAVMPKQLPIAFILLLKYPYF
jgi:hypothetical protein